MNPDFLVIGAGVAGLRAAIELAPAGSVLVVAKESLRESSSEYAQGGIAVALSDDDEVELHEQDTLYAGDGLCDRAAVHTLVEEGPAAIQELIEWGAEFDREGGRLAFTREAAHSRNRILHAHGDSTGREIARTLYRKAASLPNVTFRSFAASTDLLTADGVSGALLYDAESRTLVPVHARAVLLATGGMGSLFANTTNPEVATGDGVAMAYRAGAEIADLEFVQFHPTALHLEGAPRFLLSEALRGEGAALRNAQGERFMERYHPLLELAPRDVVARAIVSEMKRTGTEHVSLDLTHRDAGFVRQRFPRIYETCLRYGIDLERQAAPVAPAAHYAMGGVWTDLEGRTTLPGLFAAGEAACTGVHGANRLASNSLLEGVVFGARAGRAMASYTGSGKAGGVPIPTVAAAATLAQAIRKTAWEKCGIVRDGAALRQALEWASEQSPDDAESRNMLLVLELIARCALAREESRGAHYRTDFPEKRTEFERHTVIQKHAGIRFR
ncbi:MAG TPA: L-aspartate oxidase [Candidatus Sulfopaludibacter sp.]|jgi:L-aspartate oxidase|nr:L-aspartate oxidase [Candidatus Sulfopaludibacter sp.]